MRFVRPVIRTTLTVTETVRDLARLREVASVLVRHGYGALVGRLDIPGVRVWDTDLHTTPERLVAALQELGPTFVKFGQVMSTRPDLLPAPYIEALQALQDDVSPIPFAAIEGQLDRSLGADWRQRFRDIQETPTATGSVAQVHRARLPDGREVVLKVLRPGIREKIRADISVLTFLAHQVLLEFPEAVYFDPLGIIKEFERSIKDETDLRVEAANAQRFHHNFRDRPEVCIPAIHTALCSVDVLTMDHLDGVRIRDARSAGADMAKVGRAYMAAAYQMIFEDAFFHGDLHPGNVFVFPDGRLGLIDFGMVGRMTPDMKDDFVTILFALERGDYRSISRIYYDLGIKTVRVDYDAFERDVVDVMERHWVGRSLKDIQMGSFVKSLMDGAIRHRVRAPPNFTMLFKAILTTEGLAKTLIPEVDPIVEAKPYIDALVKDRFHPDRVKDELFYQLLTLRTLERRVPIVLSQVMDDIQNQRLRLSVTTRTSRSERTRTHRRHTLSVVAGMSMASLISATFALQMHAPEWAVVLGIPYLSAFLYLSSATFWLWTLFLLWKDRKG